VAASRKRLLLAVAAGLALADASIVTLALPRLLSELHATVEGVAAVIGVYTIVLAAALLPAERVRRSTGSVNLGAGGLALFAAACAACAAAGSLELLLAARAFQALGAAAALVAGFDLLGAGEEDTPGRHLWTAAAVVGFASGPAIGGLLTQLFDWRAIFVAQVPIALAGAFAARTTAETEPADSRSESTAERGPMIALGLVSASLTAVLFLLVLLLVAGWNEEPIVAAIAVSVLPLAALATRNAGGDARMLATTGCLLVAAGTLCLAFLPQASIFWTLIPQLLAGAGIGLALPRLAGRLLPERSAADAARLLTARHAGIALALLVLAPVVSANLDSATERAKERGVAVVLDSPLPPEAKLKLAPDLLAGVSDEQPRRGLQRAIDHARGGFTGEQRGQYDRLGTKADDTLTEAVAESFRLAFIITALLAVGAAVAVLPAKTRRRAIERVALAAAAIPVAYVLLRVAISPTPVAIADPCKERTTPEAPGVPGVVQDAALVSLDQIACHFGSSREQLVLALADPGEARRYKREHGVDPRKSGNLLQGLIGG
jgi:MFS family permease